MNFEKYFRQTICAWQNPTRDKFGNITSFESSPTEYLVRWSDKVDFFRGKESGEMEQSSTTILMAEELKIGDYVWLGELDDLDSEQYNDPLTIDGACPVRAVKKTPTMRAEKILYKVFL